ncbi:MAG: response regulator [Pseudomonadota bacterium]
MNNIITNHSDSPIQKILIVDDEKDLRSILFRALVKSGFICEQADNAASALELIKTQTFDLIVSDIEMPGMDGIELLKKVKADNPGIDFIIMTGYASQYSYVDIMNAGASDYMSKPFDIMSMLARIDRISREKKHLINLKKSNQELCVAIDRANRLALEAKEASKAKTFFLASMSHEIRTPLNGIVGYTDMLMDTKLDDEQKSYLNHAKFSCESLLSVVNDILDFSKVEAGKLNLENIGFDPEVLCFNTIDIVRTKVDESQVELICSVSEAVPGQLQGDPHRFRQVLLNLLSNAVKFTHQGSIKVFIDARPVDEGKTLLTISVQDTGIGIAQDKLESIFQPFVQSEDDITSRYGGTGLGLAISKKIAHKMGGDVWAQKKGDSGSIFYFTSCFKNSPNKKIKRVRPAQLKGKKVLLSSASSETLKILSYEFTLAGMDVSIAEFTELDSFLGKSLLSDISIVVIDFGKIVKSSDTDLIKKIGFIQPSKFHCDFIACSIPAPGIADTFCKAGFKGFLPTPISRIKLFEMVSYVIGMEWETNDPKASEKEIITAHLLSENKKYGASILLVEDNPVNQQMTRLMLSKAGYMIDIAVNGQEAVDKYTQTPEAYDLIFMDINMPVMNGFEATVKIREFENKAAFNMRIPILALTANVLDNFKNKCDEAGMDAFLTKPINRDIVFQAINKWIS